MNAASYLRSRRPYSLALLKPPDQVGVALLFMVIEIPVLLLLASYFNAVIPSEYGVPKPWYFPCSPIFRWCSSSNDESEDQKKKKSAESQQENGTASAASATTSTDHSHPIEIINGEPFLEHELTEAEKEAPGAPEEDADVKVERKRVLTNDFDASRTPLLLVGMRKVYGGRAGKGPKVAVKDVTYAVQEGVIFGLLGPNGAGG